MIKEFRRKAASRSHAVPLMRIEWSRLLHTPQPMQSLIFCCSVGWVRQPPKIAPSRGGSRPMVPGTYMSQPPNGISIGHLFFRAHERDRQTGRPRYSVCSNRPRLMHGVHAMRPNNNNCFILGKVVLKPCLLTIPLYDSKTGGETRAFSCSFS